MAVIKQACPKCGQRVSGDESFYGTSVDCPICTAKIFFPDPEEKEASDPKSSTRKQENRDQRADSVSEKESSSALRDLAKKRPSSSESRGDDEPPKVKVKRSFPPTDPGYNETPSPTLSIISMVLGILNAITFCLPSMLLAPAAIICGHIALIKGKFSPIQPAPGRSMAITGLILGYVGMVVMLITLALVVTGLVKLPEWLNGASSE